MRRTVAGFFALMVLLLAPPDVWAQVGGSIAGVVRDASGGVLPGVTVEATSPALIERVRTVATDGQGQYKIVELRPGTYAVTFTLLGFRTVRRESVELTTGFTATVNAELGVGGLEETITVSGASPTVDVQNSRAQRVFSEQVLEAIPIARTGPALVALALGVSSNQADVGGNKTDTSFTFSAHGSSGGDAQVTIDGMYFKTNAATSNMATHPYKENQVAIQETTIATGAMTAETESGGVQVNFVPKDGGNTFRFLSDVTYANEHMQNRNLSDKLIARGLLTAPSTRQIYDYGAGLGGPLKKDKLWFYTAHRWWGASEYVPGVYFNKTQHTPVYTPDLSRPSFTDIHFADDAVRLTWQVSPKHKVTFSQSYQTNCLCRMTFDRRNFRSPEATVSLFLNAPLTQGTWSYPATNRLLFEAGVTHLLNTKTIPFRDGATADDIAITDNGFALNYNSAADVGLTSTGYTPNTPDTDRQSNGRASMSYVTGSHAFKAGMQFYRGWGHKDAAVPQGITYTFRLGVPTGVTQWATPALLEMSDFSYGLYAQDQWTIRHLTLNLGVRFDSFKGWAQAVDGPAGPFLPPQHYDELRHIPNWKDLTPRLGASYDLFGTGKTAIKGFVGRYVQSQGIGLTEMVNPQTAAVVSTNRTWNDSVYPVGDPRRGNFVPDCVLTNFDANGECGAIDNRKFGQLVPTQRWANNVLEGFGVRPYTWQASVSLQHELRPGMAVNAGYFRTWYGNFLATDNLAVTPADFDPFCITVPVDARLPGGGGNQLCGLYDLKREKFGQVDNLVSQVSDLNGKQTQVFNGVDVELNARFPGGAFLAGGVSTGRTVTDNCYTVDSPQQLLFCHVSPPWMAATQFKVNGLYPLPWWGLQTSVIWQNLPAAADEAILAVSNAQIAPSLGRNLSACPAATGACSATATVPLYGTLSVFERNRLNQFDFRISKSLRFGRSQVRAMLDVYNLFNADTVLAATATYGPNWLKPAGIIGPRLFKGGVQVDF